MQRVAHGVPGKNHIEGIGGGVVDYKICDSIGSIPAGMAVDMAVFALECCTVIDPGANQPVSEQHGKVVGTGCEGIRNQRRPGCYGR